MVLMQLKLKNKIRSPNTRAFHSWTFPFVRAGWQRARSKSTQAIENPPMQLKIHQFSLLKPSLKTDTYLSHTRTRIDQVRKNYSKKDMLGRTSHSRPHLIKSPPRSQIIPLLYSKQKIMCSLFSRNQMEYAHPKSRLSYSSRKSAISSDYLKNENNPIKQFISSHQLNTTDLKNHKVYIGISGGVDSAVSAYLLKSFGFDVTGIHMQNWDAADDEMEKISCSSEQDLKDAQRVCQFLDMPLKTVSFVKEYWNNVFQPLLEGVKNGVTLNPDALCNQEIKFKSLLDYIEKQDPAAFYATGHYANIHYHPPLQKGSLQVADDLWKDQTYFLPFITGESLYRTIFPLGGLKKPMVREIAREIGLSNSEKKDSVGICFIGKRNFSDFLGDYLTERQGYFYDIETGQKITGVTKQKNSDAVHNGSHLFTIGQRSKISGKFSQTYVCKIDSKKNQVFICHGHDHPALYTQSLTTTEANLFLPEIFQTLSPNRPLPILAKYYHPSSTFHPAFLKPVENNSKKFLIEFEKAQRAIAPGQVITFYDRGLKECYGGANIEAPGPSLYELGHTGDVINES